MAEHKNNDHTTKDTDDQTDKNKKREKKAKYQKIDTTIRDDDLASSTSIRDLSGFTRYLFMTIAVVGALYHLYILNFNPIDPWVFRSTHLAFGTVLALMMYKGWRTRSNRVPIIESVFIAVDIFLGVYMYVNVVQLV